jgi:hypothetical protein
MLTELLAVLGVPWEQWAVLAVAAWFFALVCFLGASAPREQRRHLVRPGNVVDFRPRTKAPDVVEDRPRRAA